MEQSSLPQPRSSKKKRVSMNPDSKGEEGEEGQKSRKMSTEEARKRKESVTVFAEDGAKPVSFRQLMRYATTQVEFVRRLHFKKL